MNQKYTTYIYNSTFLEQLEKSQNNWAITFRESEFLSDSSGDLGSGGVTVQVHLIHTVPVHMTPAQLQTVDGWDIKTLWLTTDTIHWA